MPLFEASVPLYVFLQGKNTPFEPFEPLCEGQIPLCEPKLPLCEAQLPLCEAQKGFLSEKLNYALI